MAVASRLKGKSLQARVSQIQSEVKKPGPGHSKADQATHITQWLEGRKEQGAGFPTSSGGSKKMAGKVPPQFLKNEGKSGSGGKGKIPPQFLKNEGKSNKKKKAGRAAAVAKRVGGTAKKGSMPPWLQGK